MKQFKNWFKTSFGFDAPVDFIELLQSYPNGRSNGFGPMIWTSKDIVSETEDRDLIKHGVCIIGKSDSIGHILLRAKDGKIFMVDSHDHTKVDAWFSNINCFVNLLNFE